MELFTGLLGTIPAIIILIATLKLNAKSPGSERAMMMVGSVISIGVTVFYSLVVPILMQNGNHDSIAGYFGAIRVLGIAGGFLFSIGLLLFVQKFVGEKK
jgi:hypothetical protein